MVTNNFWNTVCIRKTMIVGVMVTSPPIDPSKLVLRSQYKREKQDIRA